MENTELQVVENELPKELLQIAESSGVIITEAQVIGMQFAPFMQKVNEISLLIAGIEKENPSADDAKLARQYRLSLVENRGTRGLATLHKDLKAESLCKGRLIDSYRNVVDQSSEMSELVAEKIEKHQEKLAAAKRQELKAARIALLEPYETDIEYLQLDLMDDYQFQKLLAKEKESFEAVTANRAKVEADRIEAERLAEVARIEAEKAEAERIRLQAVENERLKKEAESREKELAKERAENEKKAKEAAELLAKQNAENEAKLKAERESREKVEAELRAKQEQEEREKQQAIAEQNERDAQAKAALLAPDKDKVKAFYNQFIALQFPELESEQGKAMAVRVNEALAIVKQVIIQDSKTLL